MDRTQLCEALGLGADATDEQILAKVKEAIGAEQAVANSAKLLKLFGDELEVSVEGEFDAIANSVRTKVAGFKTAASADAAKSMAIEQLQAANVRIQALETKQAGQEWDAFVTANSRKIPPASMASYHKLWDSNRGEVEAVVNASPNLVDTSSAPTSLNAATAGGGDRVMIINSAKADFVVKSLDWGGRTCREYVAGKLAEAGKESLTADEAAKL